MRTRALALLATLACAALTACAGADTDVDVDVDKNPQAELPPPCTTHTTSEACMSAGCGAFPDVTRVTIEDGQCVVQPAAPLCMEPNGVYGSWGIYQPEGDAYEVAYTTQIHAGAPWRGWRSCAGDGPDVQQCDSKCATFACFDMVRESKTGPCGPPKD